MSPQALTPASNPPSPSSHWPNLGGDPMTRIGGWPEWPITNPPRREALPGRTVLLPGLGLTGEMLRPQVEAYGDAVDVPHWLEPRPNEALDDYARRWAEQLGPELPNDQPVFLGGVSFGGIVALEMARHLNPRATFLIASATHQQAIPLKARIAAALTGRLPEHLLRRLVPKAAVMLACREQMDDRNFALMRRMGRYTDVSFLKWAVQALMDWTAHEALANQPQPVYRIHGRRDWLLPPEREHVDHLIPDGRHLINLTHPRTVNRFLADHAWANIHEDDNTGSRWRYF